MAGIVQRFATEPPAGALAAQRDWIDSCYAADSVEEILRQLRESGVPEAEAAADELLTKSPLALKVTLAAVRRAARLDSLEAVLDQEFRVSSRAFEHPDFVEGVRARIIDKDNEPQWKPGSLAEVDDQEVARFFAPLGPGEQELGLAPGPTHTPVDEGQAGLNVPACPSAPTYLSLPERLGCSARTRANSRSSLPVSPALRRAWSASRIGDVSSGR